MLAKLPFSLSSKNDNNKAEEQKAIINGLNEQELALIYWSRSANQNNVDSRVKMGDYYYKGIGTPVDYERAVSCYRVAAELQASPLAYWNLGWMYENGIGVAKDFHLAKRAYDQALNTEQDAYLPVKLSLIKMYAKYYWEWITGHEVGPALPTTDDKQPKKKSRKQVEEEDENKWDNDIGEEMKRKYKIMKQKEREENERLEDGTTMDDPYALDEFSEEDELLESLLILGLCMLVGYLVYVRQFRFGGGGGNNNNNQRGAAAAAAAEPPNNNF
jgi:SEL1 protein